MDEKGETVPDAAAADRSAGLFLARPLVAVCGLCLASRTIRCRGRSLSLPPKQAPFDPFPSFPSSPVFFFFFCCWTCLFLHFITIVSFSVVPGQSSRLSITCALNGHTRLPAMCSSHVRGLPSCVCSRVLENSAEI